MSKNKMKLMMSFAGLLVYALSFQVRTASAASTTTVHATYLSCELRECRSNPFGLLRILPATITGILIDGPKTDDSSTSFYIITTSTGPSAQLQILVDMKLTETSVVDATGRTRKSYQGTGGVSVSSTTQILKLVPSASFNYSDSSQQGQLTFRDGQITYIIIVKGKLVQ